MMAPHVRPPVYRPTMTNKEYKNIRAAFELAMYAASIAPAVVAEVLTTVDDAVDNNMDPPDEARDDIPKAPPSLIDDALDRVVREIRRLSDRNNPA